MSKTKSAVVVLGNQLFPVSGLKAYQDSPVYMAEDWELCTYVKHHQQKIVLFLAAMREYADLLSVQGYFVHYQQLIKRSNGAYERGLSRFVKEHGVTELVHYEIEDHFFAQRIDAFCLRQGIRQTILASPMFVTSRAQFTGYLNQAKKPVMASFYKQQRERLNILIDEHGKPAGGQWSFDDQNRKKLPVSVNPPPLSSPRLTAHTKAVIKTVEKCFPEHPGHANDFWWPVTRRAALSWLREFVDDRMAHFGDYQDAISQRSATVFHSALSPMLNIGLITPEDVVKKTLAVAKEKNFPINSLEGFIRQLIGWREFVRGVYHHYDDEQSQRNFWGHHRHLTQAWYEGTTDIAPLDHAIKTANRLGWTHHIDRLMVIGNMMNLSEIEPKQAHDWFMQTHVDSSDWVMGPNVYGMALFSDGGVFATKPYIAGSNYLRKMSDFGTGPWCDVVDGLYWRFVDRHADFLSRNHRLSMTVKSLSRLKPERRERIFSAAQQFLDVHTRL